MKTLFCFIVTYTVPASAAEDWLKFMSGSHIPAILKTGFPKPTTHIKDGEVFSEDGEERRRFGVRYLFEDRMDFEEFGAKHGVTLAAAYEQAVGNITRETKRDLCTVFEIGLP